MFSSVRLEPLCDALCRPRGICMGMQCGPVQELSDDDYTAGVCLYNTGMKQLLIHLREKSLQERQQALFRISRQRYHKIVYCCLHMLASAKEKKAAH